MRRLLGFCFVLSSALAAQSASADVQACLDASERGQRARAEGKLREARDQFLLCGSETCPAMVRRDCAQWQGEVLATLPSVVLGAKDKAGRDLFDVTVSMDGDPLVHALDGKSIAVDPGPHTFEFERSGWAAVVQRALVKEGEKSRVIAVTFADGAPNADPDGAARTARGATAGGHTIYPWLVVGAGGAAMAAGLVVILTSPPLPEGCSRSTRTCTQAPGESASDFAERQTDAGRSDAQPTQGLIVGGIGVAVAAGGVLWHLLEPSAAERSGSLRVSPWAARASAGAAIGASF